MKAISVLCNHCGAPLEIAEGTRFVTCGHCGTHLKLQHKGGAAFTEVLEDIDSRTKKIAEDVSALKDYEELDRLDKDWERAKKELMVSGNNGELVAPSNSMQYGTLFTVLGIIGIVLIFRFAGPRPMLFLPAFIIFLGLYYFIKGSIKKDNYTKAKMNYEERRQRILDNLRR